MFLDKTLKNDPRLIDVVTKLHKEGQIYPDTYVVDVDQFLDNAKSILEEANKHNVSLFYMLKQLGHNPYLGKQLEEIGYKGAVVVDQKEAEVIMNNKLTICHAGHLVQPSFAFMDKLINYGCEFITIYSLQKAKEINEIAKKYNKTQKILIRVTSNEDVVYPGQTAGFELANLKNLINELIKLDNIIIAGITSFPCYLYSEKDNKIIEQNNLQTLLKAKKILAELGIENIELNAPSCTCTELLKYIDSNVTSAEPGHGLTATTPYHANNDSYEKQCIVYLTEVSHNFNGHAYVYGGGYYRRGHLNKALVISEDNRNICNVNEPSLESIDYHLELNEEQIINSAVLMAFRYQIFVSRSDICLIKGIKENNPRIVGIYSSCGVLKSE